MIIRHRLCYKRVIGVLALLVVMLCVRVTAESKRVPDHLDTSQHLRGPQNTRVNSVQPGVLHLESGKPILPVPLTTEATALIARATISSMKPSRLGVQAGDSLEVMITGSGLRAAQIVQGSLGQMIEKNISGRVSCGRDESCVVTLVTAPKTTAGDYQISLLDSNRQFLVDLPAKLTVEGQGARPVAISGVMPARLVVQPGKEIRVMFTGEGLRAIQAVEAQLRDRRVDDIQGRLSCRSQQECQLDLATAPGVQAGEYPLALLDARGQKLALLPARFIIAKPFLGQPTPPTNLGDPDAVVVLGADEDIILSRSCTPPPYDTFVTLQTPINGDLLFPQSVMHWARTAHEMCVPPSSYAICDSQPFERFYDVIVCTDECDPHYLIQVCIPPHYIGGGEFLWDSQHVSAMLTALNVDYGASLNWSVRYQDDDDSLLSEFSDWSQFTVASNAPVPEQPVLYWPPHNHTIGKEVLFFNWDKDTPNLQVNYKLCLQEVSASVGCATAEIDSEHRSITLNGDDFISRGLYGKKIEYKVRTCNVDNECSPYSEPFELFTSPPPAVLNGPESLAEASLPITLPWQSVAGVSSYKLKLRSTSFPQATLLFEVDNGTSYFLTTTDLPPGCFNQSLKWSVQTCKIIEGVEICSSPTFAETVQSGRKEKFLQLTNAPAGTCNPDGFNPGLAQVNFTDDLASVFSSPSCTTCHGLRQGTSQLPTGHIPVSINSSSCGTCHDNKVRETLEDETGQLYADIPLLDVQWHAPAGMNFIGVNVNTLCTMAQNPGSVATDDTKYPASLGSLDAVERHLAYDPLILWAVVGGTLPAGGSRANVDPAYSGTLQEWQELVGDWVQAGMPCQ